MAGHPAVAQTFFSFLPHFCHSLRKPEEIVPMTPAEMDPGFFTDTGVVLDRNAAKTGLQDILDRVLARRADLRKLRFAVADLTTDLFLFPQFAGNLETKQGGLGSMAKLAIMYTAFQLKFDLEQIAKQQNLKTEAELFKAARAMWAETQKLDASAPVTELHPGEPGIPKIELLGKLVKVAGKRFPLPIRPDAATPNLERVFTLTSTGLEFRGSDLVLLDKPGAPHTSPGAQVYVDRTKENINAARKLTFAERLFLAIDESDNICSHTCVQDLGYLYIASSLFQSGLYNPKRNGGLWEGSSHAKMNWEKSFVADKADFQNSTPAAIVAFLTLLAQGRLVSPTASTAMRHLISKLKNGLTLVIEGKRIPVRSYTRSFLGEGLAAAIQTRPDGTKGFRAFGSKIGIGDFHNDCALAQREDRGKELHYAVAAFDDGPSLQGLKDLVVEIDMSIQERNGLTPDFP
jgi:hypothetical protein